ncbi:MFS transporter [Sphingopyxis granuli]|uniref:MFS transporter n=1 Tax=Sphingopyxis granuli TaxID=267128 RepID=UPI00301C4B29
MQQLDLQVLVDKAKFNRFHGLVLFWCMLILICDGYDLAVVGAALPAIMDDMKIDAATAGVMAGSALLGTMLGAIFLGSLADRVGRRRMIVICVILFSLFTAATGLTSDPVSFSIARFLAGLGIGGVLPIATAQMSEFAPLKLRSRLVTLVFAGYSIGGVLVAVISKGLIESHGWQSVFYVAGLPILMIPFLLRTMPESLAYLVNNGRHEELAALAKRIDPSFPADAELAIVAKVDSPGAVPAAKLFKDGRAWSTLMIWVAFMTGLFMVYALNSWLTKLMAMSGHSLGSALNFVIVFNLGSIVGGFLGGWLSDRLSIKYVLAAFYLAGAISLTILGYTTATTMLFVMVFIVGASTLGTQLLAYAYAGDFYPAAIRSSGVGFASGMGRIGAIIAPVLIGWLITLSLPLEYNFMMIGIAGLIGAAAVLLANQNMAASTRERAAAGGR